MDLKQQYPANVSMAEDGVKVPMDGAVFILTYYKSAKVQMAFQVEVQKLKHEGLSHEDAAIKAMRSVLVKAVVLGWENLTEDGKLVEYSPSECRRILDTYVGLDTALMEKAGDIALFREKQQEETAGN